MKHKLIYNSDLDAARGTVWSVLLGAAFWGCVLGGIYLVWRAR